MFKLELNINICMTLVPFDSKWTQLFAYSGLEESLLKMDEESPYPHGLRRICEIEVRTAVIVDKTDGKLASIATDYRPNSFRNDADYPLVRGTLFHVGTGYLERDLIRALPEWRLHTILPKERITAKEEKVKVRLPPAEYEFDPFQLAESDPNYFMELRKDPSIICDTDRAGKICAETLDVESDLMREIIKAKVSKPLELREGALIEGWPKSFDIGKGRTVVIGEAWGDRIYDKNNFWEVKPEDLLLVNATRTFELDWFELKKNHREGKTRMNPDDCVVAMINKKGKLVDYTHGEATQILDVKVPRIANAAT